jgi:1,2-diacylglycerol 3-beta-galactosyltransferase
VKYGKISNHRPSRIEFNGLLTTGLIAFNVFLSVWCKIRIIASGIFYYEEWVCIMAGSKRIMILTADAGFGHRSASKAIETALLEQHPTDCKVEILNPLDDKRLPKILRKSGANYDRTVRQSPGLYKLQYEASDGELSSAVVQTAVAALISDVLAELLERQQPDAIITPYPMFQGALEAAFAQNKRCIPFLTVVTDHAPVTRMWFHKAADWCLVPSPSVREQAIEAGLSPEKVKVTGIPVHPDLANDTREPAAVRAELDWEPERSTLLAVGSKRVKRLMELLNVLNHSGLPLQFALIAGGDDKLYQRFQEEEWHVPIHLYNFVENMPTLMHAADMIVCKAGGLIVTEALDCGLPILLTDYIEGQETSNVNYVVDGEAGVLVEKPLEGLETLFHWLADGGKLLAQTSRNARRLSYPQAAYDVAQIAWEAAVQGPEPIQKESLPEKIEKIVKDALS